MLKEEISDRRGGGAGGDNNWARLCDTCRSAACTVYCRADSAYLCASCDARVHAANRVASRHERVWVCESCERAPAEFLCKADAASLCASCDADIHSANPLARRHQRVPILPIAGCLYGPLANDPGDELETEGETDDGFVTEEAIGEEEEEEAASWLLLNPGKISNGQSNGLLFGGEVDEYLDLVEYNSGGDNRNQFSVGYNPQQQFGVAVEKSSSYGSDSVVPVQCREGGDHHHHHHHHHQQFHHQNFQLGLEYESSKAHYAYSGSINHSVSMDVGVVPESAMSEISGSQTRLPKGTIDLFSGNSIQIQNMAAAQLSPMDREARVLRYREKKKTRKFEKTIRYASRKAYAETRPRIKGRFAKRTNVDVEVDVEVDQIFSTTLPLIAADTTGYGIVPSF